jgi:hypothetical protein
VDFLLQVGRELWAIEAKASREVSGRSLSGFASLGDQVPRVKRKIVVFLGTRRQVKSHVEILPLEEFLGELPP